MARPKWLTKQWWSRQVDPGYPSAPMATESFPPGVPFIIGNEAAERFSFYGMRAILVVFMTQYLLSGDSTHLDVMSDEEAKAVFHLFNAGVYFFPILGALIADGLLGKYWTIITLSLVYVAGHTALAWDESRLGLYLGLALIALGSGGIKSCVSAHVGDQFSHRNKHWLSRVFSWFYLAINIGAATSSILTPLLLEWYGPGVAFGVPGILMAIATLLFFLGRWRFAHIPAGGTRFLRESFSREGLGAVARLVAIFVPTAMFWALFDQSGSAWVLQAQKMNLNFAGVTWTAAQIQAVNPVLVLIMVPLSTEVVYPLWDKLFDITPLRKMTVGMFLASGAFVVSALIEHAIAAGITPSVGWQLVAYVIITAAEILVSITSLEFAYTQAPKTMKSVVMGVFLLSIALGNVFTAMVNVVIEHTDMTLGGPRYFWFFVACMLLAACVFSVIAYFYRGREYLQD